MHPPFKIEDVNDVFTSLLNKFVYCALLEKATPSDQTTASPATSSQPLPISNTSYSKVVSSCPAASLGNSPCHSPMLQEEDELSGTGESEGEDEEEGPGPQGMESEPEVTEVDMNDMDMNKVCSFQSTQNIRVQVWD